MSKTNFSHLSLSWALCVLLCIMGSTSCVQNTSNKTLTVFGSELLSETPGSITTKDTIIGRDYIREGETKNFVFRVIKTYHYNCIDFYGEFDMKRVGLVPWKSTITTTLSNKMSDEELQIALQYISRKNNWENTDYEEISPVSPMGGSVKIPIIPKSAN